MGERDVFINCPFSSDYREKFEAIIFVVMRSGFVPRSARENDDGGEVRIEKICRIIEECPYGVHDISKTEPDPTSGLPRFNMPLELGLFLGARKFGGRKHETKRALILDSGPYRYQAFISDIAGQDIHCHGSQVERLIEEIARWLRDEARDRRVPGGRAITTEFAAFSPSFPKFLSPYGFTGMRPRSRISAPLSPTGSPSKTLNDLWRRRQNEYAPPPEALGAREWRCRVS